MTRSELRGGIVASLLLAASGCHVPPETRGADDALAIHRRGVLARRAEEHAARTPGAANPQARVRTLQGPLTVDDAIRLAVDHSPRLAELDARVSAADAAVEAAGERENPDLRATNVQAGRAVARGEDLRVVPRVRYSPERPGEIGAREAEARAASREARAEARAERDAIEAEVRWCFDDVVLLDAEIDAHARMAAARRRLASQTRAQVDDANARAIDGSLAELAALEVDVQVAERRSRRALVAAALADRMGVVVARQPPVGSDARRGSAVGSEGTGAGSELVLAGDPMTWPPTPLPDEDALIETALSRSPRIAAAAARIDGSSARLDREKTRRWPWFKFVEVGYDFGPNATSAPLWTVGAGIELPIVSVNTGGIHRAEAARAEATGHLAAEVEEIERDVRARLREANEAARLVTELRAAALPALEVATKEATRALESGAIDVTRAIVLDERRARVEVELLRLVRSYRAAVDRLRRATFGPLPSARNAGPGPGGARTR